MLALSSLQAQAQRKFFRELRNTLPADTSELAKESREAAGEDEQAQFKHSASVQLVAKLTGLSLDSAYWLCVLLNFAVIAGAIVYLSKKNLPGRVSRIAPLPSRRRCRRRDKRAKRPTAPG